MSMMEKLKLMEQMKKDNNDRLVKAGLIRGCG